MTDLKTLVQNYEDALNAKEEFIFSFKKYSSYEIDANTRIFKKTILNDYPVENLFTGITRRCLIPSEITENEALELNSLKKEDFDRLNKIYADLGEHERIPLLILADEIINNPLPEAPLNEFQKLFMQLDPYATKIKEKLKKRNEILGDPKQYYDLELFQEITNKIINSTIPWDFEIFPLKNELCIERIPPNQQNPKEPDIYPPLIVSILKQEPTLAGNSYEESLKYMENFFEDLEKMRIIHRITARGIIIKELALSSIIPQKYKNLIWLDGDAIEKHFDVRAIYHFVLLTSSPNTDENIKNIFSELNSHMTSVLKKYFSDYDNRPTPVRATDYKTWKTGPQLFQSLQRILSEF